MVENGKKVKILKYPETVHVVYGCPISELTEQVTTCNMFFFSRNLSHYVVRIFHIILEKLEGQFFSYSKINAKNFK